MRQGRRSSGYSRRFGAAVAAFGLMIVGVCAPSLAGVVEGVVIDHPPLPTGGLASDTSFANMFGDPFWQRVADDFILTEPATLLKVRWWGFYHLDNPPPSETMRIRFYGARPGDGLPDESNIVFEESFLDPFREATGQTVFTGVDPDEYVYEADLGTPLALDAATPYWLEIVQIDDLNTTFRWEVSQADQNGQAFINPITIDWDHTFPNLTADTAFQLSTVPEPSVIALFTCSTVVLLRRRRTCFGRCAVPSETAA